MSIKRASDPVVEVDEHRRLTEEIINNRRFDELFHLALRHAGELKEMNEIYDLSLGKNDKELKATIVRAKNETLDEAAKAVQIVLREFWPHDRLAMQAILDLRKE